jgi:hypothetical protein
MASGSLFEGILAAELFLLGNLLFVLQNFFFDRTRLFSRDTGPLAVIALLQPFPQHLQRQLLIAPLMPLGLDADHNPRGAVMQTHGGLPLVHILPTMPAGAKGIHIAFREQIIIQGRNHKKSHCRLFQRSLIMVIVKSFLFYAIMVA